MNTIIKKQLPVNGELVLIKIKKIMPHGAYCELIEYNTEAYLPISEIASGWIKNIHEFIKEGQKDIAKVISVDVGKRAIDISLKKTTARDKREKMNGYNLEKRAERLFNQATVAAKVEPEKDALTEEVSRHVSTYAELINGIAENKDFIKFLKNERFREALFELVSKNIKPKRYKVTYTAEIKANRPDTSIYAIKKALEEVSKLGIDILYLGAPRYRLVSEDVSYPKAEGRVKESEKILGRYSKNISFSLKSDRHEA